MTLSLLSAASHSTVSRYSQQGCKASSAVFPFANACANRSCFGFERAGHCIFLVGVKMPGAGILDAGQVLRGGNARQGLWTSKTLETGKGFPIGAVRRHKPSFRSIERFGGEAEETLGRAY